MSVKKNLSPETTMPIGLIGPKASVGFTVAPRGRLFANRAGGSLRDKDLRAGDSGQGTERPEATKLERINRVFKIPPFEIQGKSHFSG
jgi:hypothetical protein